ncbi:MAG: DUF1887 family protein [Chitinophagales bacterium]|nr:DUF1887 family protein [Chitinophagales bacterium]MCZ2392498.1 DUF1887 family protein [Chitinophagales bacterium]
MPHQNPLVQSLLELSDAIEQLATTIARQKNSDQQIQQKQLSVITQKFKHATQLIHPATQQDNAALIQQKYQNGFLKEHLDNQGIFISTTIENLRADENLYKAVDYLQDHYTLLKDFYAHLKRSQVLKKDFNHKNTAHAIRYIQDWCKILHHYKIIDGFKVLNHSEIFVDIAQIAEATSFINGYWLEVLLRREIALFLHAHLSQIQSFDILSQTTVLKQDNTNTELDLLLMINQKVYWFECKSGQINNYFERFKDTKEDLGISDNRAFLVIPAQDNNIPLHAKKRSNMLTLFGTELETQLKKHLDL